MAAHAQIPASLPQKRKHTHARMHGNNARGEVVDTAAGTKGVLQDRRLRHEIVGEKVVKATADGVLIQRLISKVRLNVKAPIDGGMGGKRRRNQNKKTKTKKRVQRIRCLEVRRGGERGPGNAIAKQEHRYGQKL